MGVDKSGAGYGNHGGDETFEDNKQQSDQSRDVPDDSGRGDYEEQGEGKPQD
jgi:hypothetical protein